jgi:hypothetical protein
MNLWKIFHKYPPRLSDAERVVTSDDEKDTIDRIEGGNPGTRYTIVNEAGLYEAMRQARRRQGFFWRGTENRARNRRW